MWLMSGYSDLCPAVTTDETKDSSCVIPGIGNVSMSFALVLGLVGTEVVPANSAEFGDIATAGCNGAPGECTCENAACTGVMVAAADVLRGELTDL